MSDKPSAVIFMGRSGCGKGTQAELFGNDLKEKRPEYGVLYVETGKKFREFISGTSYSSRKARGIMESGELQPSFLAIHMWSNIFTENITGNEHIILDGTPRTLDEAETLNGALVFYEREPIYVIHIDVSRVWSLNRLAERGRADDKSISDIKKRLDWFDTDVMPAIKYFDNSDRYNVIKINGERTIDDVHKDISKAIKL